MNKTDFTLFVFAIAFAQAQTSPLVVADDVDVRKRSTLVFQVDRQTAINRGFEVNESLLENVARQIRQRIQEHDGGAEKTAPVRVEIDKKRECLILVLPEDASSDRVESVKEVLQKDTWVEFALLANQDRQATLIEIAIHAANLKVNRVYQAGQLAGLWLPVAVDRSGKPKIQPDSHVVTRAGPNGKDSPLEYLVVVGAEQDLRLTGLDFVKVAKRKTDFGFVLEFELNQHGAALMQAVTSQNLPDSPTEGTESSSANTNGQSTEDVETVDRNDGAAIRSRLAIIINEEIQMAPNIQGVISSRGVITGNFTEAEVDELVKSLNLPPLGVPLLLLNEF